VKTVYFSLGTNLGDRWAALVKAVSLLDGSGIQVLRVSSVYETEPQGLKSQPWFLNLVVEARTSLFPRQLLARVQRIERELGRRRKNGNRPRIIDIDILLYGDAVIRTQELGIPHQRMAKRRFVMQPLAELAPGLRHPMLRLTPHTLLARLSRQVVKKTGWRLPPHGPD
jgi:2-amino-4-hydroxy-6-hydroxymethyldihydropteridine diphosphokinase